MMAAPHIDPSPQPKPAGLRDCDGSFAGEPSGSQPFLGVSSLNSAGLRPRLFLLEVPDNLSGYYAYLSEAFGFRPLAERLDTLVSHEGNNLAHLLHSVARNSECRRRLLAWLQKGFATS